jgi:hypothetical protein
MIPGIVAGGMRRVVAPQAVNPTVWDTSFNPSFVTITESGRRAQMSVGDKLGRTVFGAQAGRWYIEFNDTLPGLMGVGVARADLGGAVNIFANNASRSIVYYISNRVVYFNGVPQNPAVGTSPSLPVGLEIDLSAPATPKIKFKNGGGSSPEFVLASAEAHAYHVAIGLGNNTSSFITLNAGQDPFVFTVPEGAIAGFGPSS